MTISNAPDEDADNLDDDSLLEAYLGIGQPAAQDTLATALPDWPDDQGGSLMLDLDPGTLAWFQSHHGDWKREISLVLRAWVAAADQAGTTLR